MGCDIEGPTGRTARRVVAMAKAYGVTSLDKVTGAGNLSVDLHAAGPVANLSSDQLMKALNGTINVNFNNMRYTGIDVGHQVLSMIGSKQPTKDQGYTNVQKMTGAIVVKSGVAQTNNLQATLDIGNVGAVGTANLVSQALNMQIDRCAFEGVHPRNRRRRRVYDDCLSQQPGRTRGTGHGNGNVTESEDYARCAEDGADEAEGADSKWRQSAGCGIFDTGWIDGTDRRGRPELRGAAATESCQSGFGAIWPKEETISGRRLTFSGCDPRYASVEVGQNSQQPQRAYAGHHRDERCHGVFSDSCHCVRSPCFS